MQSQDPVHHWDGLGGTDRPVWQQVDVPGKLLGVSLPQRWEDGDGLEVSVPFIHIPSSLETPLSIGHPGATPASHWEISITPRLSSGSPRVSTEQRS